ncbi:MAG: heme o synthase [Patescibacteria group bacterium]|nr:heme o synthase [Patescibacteria group bacterium]
MLKAYYQLTKPGLIYGNLFTAVAGFLLAARGRVDLRLLFFCLLGLALVIGAGCVLNNIADRDMDAKMDRTRSRALVTGEISKPAAAAFGSALLGSGVIILFSLVNIYALAAAVAGFIIYIFLYTPLKGRTAHATVVGSLAGAMPPLVGFSAAAGRPSLEAAVLFLAIAFWQMPHFYAIAIFRADEYAAAGVPVLPLRFGLRSAKIQILLYVTGFTAAAAALGWFKPSGAWYVGGVGLLGLLWLGLAIRGLAAAENKRWARQMFFFSLIVLVLTSVLIAA